MVRFGPEAGNTLIDMDDPPLPGVYLEIVAYKSSLVI
jgi:hypothetical protein